MVKLDHLTLFVRDYPLSRDWYVNRLGLAVEFQIPERGVAAVQDTGGFTIFLEQRPAAPADPACVLYFQVDSVDAAWRRLAAEGVAFTSPPAAQFWGYGAELADPDGHLVRLWDAVSMHAARE